MYSCTPQLRGIVILKKSNKVVLWFYKIFPNSKINEWKRLVPKYITFFFNKRKVNVIIDLVESRNSFLEKWCPWSFWLVMLDSIKYNQNMADQKKLYRRENCYIYAKIENTLK